MITVRKETVLSRDTLPRQTLPIRDPEYVGYTAYDAKDPQSKFPKIERLLPPTGAPNVLIVLIDDAGFGSGSAFGGPCRMPTAEKLAESGVKLTRFHTTALCSPTRQALLTGRNHHSVNMGSITEMATSAPGYTSVRPKDKAPMAQTLNLNGYATAALGKTPQCGQCLDDAAEILIEEREKAAVDLLAPVS